MNSPYLTIKECAAYFKVNPSTIYRLLKRKELPAFRVGRDWRFQREDIDRWVDQQTKIQQERAVS